jgi:hypothetical protein
MYLGQLEFLPGMGKNVMNNKIEFIKKELLILAWAASIQRANLYRKNTGSNQSSIPAIQFRKGLITFLTEKIIPQYVKGCPEENHYRNIEALITHANKIDPGILGTEGYKYGVAQKLLNLALKYCWCLGLGTEPPHCPIDRIIISQTSYDGKINWTRILRRSEYKDIIKELKVLAENKGLTIAQWELANYSRR